MVDEQVTMKCPGLGSGWSDSSCWPWDWWSDPDHYKGRVPRMVCVFFCPTAKSINFFWLKWTLVNPSIVCDLNQPPHSSPFPPARSLPLPTGWTRCWTMTGSWSWRKEQLLNWTHQGFYQPHIGCSYFFVFSGTCWKLRGAYLRACARMQGLVSAEASWRRPAPPMGWLLSASKCIEVMKGPKRCSDSWIWCPQCLVSGIIASQSWNFQNLLILLHQSA